MKFDLHHHNEVRQYATTRELAEALITEEANIWFTLCALGAKVDEMRNDLHLMINVDVMEAWLQAHFTTDDEVIKIQDVHVLGQKYTIIRTN